MNEKKAMPIIANAIDTITKLRLKTLVGPVGALVNVGVTPSMSLASLNCSGTNASTSSAAIIPAIPYT
ncbi:hypothetical protein D3C72_2338510 [compost metagenome]